MEQHITFNENAMELLKKQIQELEETIDYVKKHNEDNYDLIECLQAQLTSAKIQNKVLAIKTKYLKREIIIA